MTDINVSIDDKLLKEFRHVIYIRSGLKKGDFKKTIEDAMFDYVQKYSSSDSAKELAKRAQSQRDPESRITKLESA